MLRDILDYHRKGKLTEERIFEAMFTSMGSALYTYMVMLTNSGREREANRMDDLRKRIFDLRNDWAMPEMDAVAKMKIISTELKMIYEMLQDFKPEEATIFQSVTNEAIGMSWLLKEYFEKKQNAMATAE